MEALREKDIFLYLTKIINSNLQHRHERQISHGSKERCFTEISFRADLLEHLIP